MRLLAGLMVVTGLLFFSPASFPQRQRRVRARVGKALMELREISWERNARLRVTPQGAAADVRDQATVRLLFVLGARTPDELARYVEPTTSFRATDDQGGTHDAIVARLQHSIRGPSLQVLVAGLPPTTRRLRKLEGELLAYPRARRIRFHIPWLKDKLPLEARYGGGVATLTRFRLVEDDSWLWVRFRAPEGYRIPNLRAQPPFTARAYEVNGNLVNNGGIREIVQTKMGPEPEYRFYAPDMFRLPSRLQVDMTFVDGEPEPVAFEVGEIVLPAGRAANAVEQP